MRIVSERKVATTFNLVVYSSSDLTSMSSHDLEGEGVFAQADPSLSGIVAVDRVSDGSSIGRRSP